MGVGVGPSCLLLHEAHSYTMELWWWGSGIACLKASTGKVEAMVGRRCSTFHHIHRSWTWSIFRLPDASILVNPIGHSFSHTSTSCRIFTQDPNIRRLMPWGFPWVYHPQANGQVERANQEVGCFLCTYWPENHNDWARLIGVPWAEYAQNSLRHSATKLPPYPWNANPTKTTAMDEWFQRTTRCKLI